MVREAHVNIGGNLGDCQGNIARAVKLIAERTGVSVRVSRPVVSPPWGFSSDNDFVNIGVAFTTDIEPLPLLRLLLEIEREISAAPHRDASGGYCDRLIDIDLIAMDDVVIDTPELTLPHPRMHLREFVLIPLNELAPSWHHPLTGMTAAYMLRNMSRNTSSDPID